MPIPDLGGFLEKIDLLSLNLTTTRTELAETRKDLEGTEERLDDALDKARRARLIALIGILTAAAGVWAGVSGRATANDLAAARKDNRRAACIQANVQTQKTRSALVAGVKILDVPDPGRSPERQAGLEKFLTDYGQAVSAALPYRDCSEAGLTRYYDHAPSDPAEEKTK